MFKEEYQDYRDDILTDPKRKEKKKSKAQKNKKKKKQKKAPKKKKKQTIAASESESSTDDISDNNSSTDEEVDEIDPMNELLKDEIKAFLKLKEEKFIQLNNLNFEQLTDNDVLFHLSIRKHHPIKHKENFKDSCLEFLPIENTASNAGKNHRLLKHLIKRGNLVGFCQNFNHPNSMIKDPENCCICLMHCIMRVSEKLITMLLINALKEHGKTVYNNQIKPCLEAIINGKLSNTLESFDLDADNDLDTKLFATAYLEKLEASHIDSENDFEYDFRLKESSRKGGGVDNFKISYSRMLRLLEVIDQLIKGCSFKDSTTNDTYTDIFETWMGIMGSLFQEKTFLENEITDLWDKIIHFRKIYLDKFGTQGVTNYIHILISGHVIEMIRAFGSIAKYSGIGFESLVGRVRSFLMRRTNKAGHIGVKKDNANTIPPVDVTVATTKIIKKKATHADNIFPFMLRRSARQLESLSINNISDPHKYKIDTMKSEGTKLSNIARYISNYIIITIIIFIITNNLKGCV